ncbi:hypothetical protein SKAU_G00248140 [Synaphobranchus kaupii]|uniref:Uncharacterized protein n=1 Tax=Synaphobranchus kaupii TaxID=118154 RepID=A0A9Q1IPJ1_SYNKA|nr:hypothetical protein SKAU_G00248140 [Synaphobranchus kaupii]
MAGEEKGDVEEGEGSGRTLTPSVAQRLASGVAITASSIVLRDALGVRAGSERAKDNTLTPSSPVSGSTVCHWVLERLPPSVDDPPPSRAALPTIHIASLTSFPMH